MSRPISIAVHGGAGTILPELLTPALEKEYKHHLQLAIDTGHQLLSSGESALVAAAAAVSVLEDCELFNAGKGSVFTAEGQHEMDAAIMCGKTLEAGSVAAVTGIKNPIQLAHRVLTHSEHVMLIGKGAEQFAKEHGLKFENPEYFFNQYRYDQWQQLKGTKKFQLDHSEAIRDRKHGTVGAVCLDLQGNLAAATSTGGMTNKQYGRVGDSALIGVGNYANNKTCAVSCTGSGEFFIRSVVAYDISALMEHTGMSLEKAAEKVIHQRMLQEGDGGVIAVDRFGNIAMPFNSAGMYRAAKKNNEPTFVAIYK
ncbi:MAG: isoaspartyl peptidase/L-asparaginase [Saprospiraceae bacterium]|nr:isoaspartyl peptidase/L-asparaginase [Saprospiraceae bacterium]